MQKLDRAGVPVDDEDDDDDRNALGDEELLEFLFGRGDASSYAFPTDLTSFLVERLTRVEGSQQWKTIVGPPQRAYGGAEGMCAGQIIVINKATYWSGVWWPMCSDVHGRAAPLFAEISDLVIVIVAALSGA